jgi:hypothetical protein
MNAELEAIATELENQIDKADDVIKSVSMVSEQEAYTSANKQIMEATNKQDVKMDEMVELLKAIRDIQAGRADLNVEVM